MTWRGKFDKGYNAPYITAAGCAIALMGASIAFVIVAVLALMQL